MQPVVLQVTVYTKHTLLPDHLIGSAEIPLNRLSTGQSTMLELKDKHGQAAGELSFVVQSEGERRSSCCYVCCRCWKLVKVAKHGQLAKRWSSCPVALVVINLVQVSKHGQQAGQLCGAVREYVAVLMCCCLCVVETSAGS